MPTLAELARAGGSGVVGGALGWPMDALVNLANLARAGYGVAGHQLGLLNTDQLPQMIDPANVPGTSARLSGLLGVGDSGGEQIAQLVGGLLAPGPKIGPQKAIKTYHGSPHTFDKFDISKIGTGEGAQAYGHGLYFAESPAVAKQYQDALKWRGADWDNAQVVATQAVERTGDRVTAANELKRALDMNSKSKNPMQVAANDTTKRAISILDSGAPLSGKPPTDGQMYETNLRWPDPAREAADPLGPQHFLDWDKPLSEQPQVVRDAIGRLPGGKDSLGWKNAPPGMYDRAMSSPSRTGEWVYRDMLSNDPTAAQHLRDVGIPGIRYLDAGSRGAGSGTSNYVVFDDALAEILARNGIPVR